MQKIQIKKELTPASMNCSAVGCPAIFETNQDSYILIGKVVDSKELGISERIGKNEIAVEIPKRLINKKQNKN
jgi:hypothetical protein